MPPERAARPDAASSVAPVVIHYRDSLRPCLRTSIAPRRRATFRQALLVLQLRLDGGEPLLDAVQGLGRLRQRLGRLLEGQAGFSLFGGDEIRSDGRDQKRQKRDP